jgi:hypothetical protein
MKVFFHMLRRLRFWLGLGGLVFLLAAWVQSMHQGRGFGWGGKGRGFFMAHGGGSLRLGMDNGSLRAPGLDQWSWDMESSEVSRPEGDPVPRWPAFPPPHLLLGQGSSEISRVMIPHWLMVSLYLALWGGPVLLGRMRAAGKSREPASE